METGSIAHVCYANSVPFLSIRSITDTADHSGLENFEKNCEESANISKDVTLALKNYKIEISRATLDSPNYRNYLF